MHKDINIPPGRMAGFDVFTSQAFEYNGFDIMEHQQT
jgi:hypothetical protein